MLDGIYQSVMVFFIPYLTVIGSSFITASGHDVSDRLRLGSYIAHPAVVTINLYILINTYRWDWLMVLAVVISDLFIFFWTGVYTSTTYAGVFYSAAPQVYGEASFWACFFITPVICIFPRFAIKALQKVYFPYDVDVIREQVTQGKFQRLDNSNMSVDSLNGTSTGSSEGPRKPKHSPNASIDDDKRPIYPPSVGTHNTHTQNGSDGTNYTNHQQHQQESMEIPVRPSMDRVRPSYDRMRASMDLVRPSFEQSNDFTSAARLSRLESSRSRIEGQMSGPPTTQGPQNAQGPAGHSIFNKSRLRGMSILSNKSKHTARPQTASNE